MPEPTVKLVLTTEQVNLVLAGLAELPFKVVNALCYTIQRQAMEQLNQQKLTDAPRTERELSLVRESAPEISDQ